MPKTWTADEINALMRAYQPACVLAAAAELDLFSVLASAPAAAPLTAAEVAARVSGDVRGITALLDALAALEFLNKSADRYTLAPGIADALTAAGPQNMLGMTQHQANCLRRWSRLAEAAKSGRPVQSAPSIRGEAGDKQSFIQAMADISAPIVDSLLASLPRLPFTHLLDVGGGSGTWTLGFLRLNPRATATIFDLPHVIPMARDRLSRAGVLARVRLVAGDFTKDPLPAGADLVFISAIIHQQSRGENRKLYAAAAAALQSNGHILIRDIIMDNSRTQPVSGALFALNMLVGTATGGTFTLSEIREDLAAAGFTDIRQLRQDEGMHAFVAATLQ